MDSIGDLLATPHEPLECLSCRALTRLNAFLIDGLRQLLANDLIYEEGRTLATDLLNLDAAPAEEPTACRSEGPSFSRPAVPAVNAVPLSEETRGLTERGRGEASNAVAVRRQNKENPTYGSA